MCLPCGAYAEGCLFNLSLTLQGKCASALTEALRSRQENEEIRPLFEQMVSSYREMYEAIEELSESQTGGSRNG